MPFSHVFFREMTFNYHYKADQNTKQGQCNEVWWFVGKNTILNVKMGGSINILFQTFEPPPQASSFQDLIQQQLLTTALEIHQAGTEFRQKLQAWLNTSHCLFCLILAKIGLVRSSIVSRCQTFD